MIRKVLPLGLGALVLAVGALLLVVNLAVMAAGHPPIKLVPGLIGVTDPEVLPTGWASVLDGRFQAVYGRLIGTQMPLYPAAVRLRNQVQFSLLGFSPTPSVIVGRDDVLIERAYAEDYCSREIAAWRPGAVAWASKIKAMQDEQERRGKAFLYVLTPSKAAQYPELLPVGYRCPAPVADRVGLVRTWLAILQAAGVHVVDTTAVLWKAHGAYPFRLYPDGGTHWNAVGEALGEQAILRGMDQILPGRGLAPGGFTYAMAAHPGPNSDEADLARLMNLFVRTANGPVPVTTAQPVPAAGACQPPRVAIVGGSFAIGSLRALLALACPVVATEYEYWHTFTLQWNAAGMVRQPGVDGAARAVTLRDADIIVYEENEQVLRQPSAGQELFAFLMHSTP
ncbi:alginate O-acetyltransferase AlgX-related protein [Acidisphaera sp. L21]|uniref:alginate O-acetyltransferase AlgX-related protein n=1 Tax=Acidisphaera sp. L21 TaxID=1641851 RepID=UPI00131CE63A|nr:hypothetical protein [Acidisphaera sp. L21]